MDGMAHAAGMDPLEFRVKNIEDARLRAVFEAAADKFGWGRAKSTPERGFGIAGGAEKGGYVATCAEVEIDPASKKIRIRRVVRSVGVGRGGESRWACATRSWAQLCRESAAHCLSRFSLPMAAF
jgi:CO/xanthine dehydrogenase Mo-binding subunit